MKYVVHRRFKDNTICGSINLPAMTECECEDGLITYNNTAICYATSENAHQFFAVNEDGMGMERGRLTQSIQKALAKHEVQGTELSAENQKLKTIYDNDGADGLARYYLYKKNADADGNGSLRKDEIIPYLDSLGLSQQEKRTYFSYLSSAKNPY